MYENALSVYAFGLGYCERLSAELDDAALYQRATASLHAPAWILGHLSIATDWAGRILGLERVCPASWHRAFSPGRTGEMQIEERPTKQEFLAALSLGHERVSASVAGGVDEARMAQPHTIATLTGTPIRTWGDALLHLMTAHEAMHLGQLSVCRRATGLPALF